MDTLREIVLRTDGAATGEGLPLDRWLPRKQLQTWWDSREELRTNDLIAAGLLLRPKLVIQAGGGRGNPNRYSLEFESIPQSTPIDADPGNVSGVTYSRRQLKGSLLYRWLLPGHPVRLQSWRGFALVLGFVVSVLAVLAVWLLFLAVLRSPGPVTSTQVTFALLAVMVTGIVFFTGRPWLRLPDNRLIIAPDVVLPWAEPFGQLQLVRERGGKRTGWLNLVRYSASCPVCAGTIELTEGRRDFPGRIIGRCRESPLEHVYSFDPVSLSGRALRQD
jgi:hypothetical protein